MTMTQSLSMASQRKTSREHVMTPLIIERADDIAWDEEADVVVVGFGGAGVIAALQAREGGADVLAIDRFGGGGATNYSGGVIYAGGTRHQAAAGFHDTPEEMFKYLSAEGNALGPEALRRFCEGSSGDLEWLEAHGVPYGSTVYLQKTAYPPPGHWLYYSGNERLPKFKDVAKPAPRGHLPVTPGFGGHLHYSKLREAALAKGVKLMSHAPARRLILDRDRRVVGVEVKALPQELWAKHDELYAVVHPWKPLNGEKSERAIAKCRQLEARVDTTRRIRARAGVILSTGGYIYNLDMLQRYRPLLARNYTGLLRLGSMGCDGSGIELGQTVGGKTRFMDRYFLGRPLAPPEAFIYGLMVNVRGERFTNEDAYQSLFGDKLVEQPEEGRALLILDHKQFWKGVKQSLFPGKGLFKLWGAPALLNIAMGGTRRGRNLQALARKARIDPVGLQNTVSEHNARVRLRQHDPLGKSPDKMVSMEKGPYYAVNVSLSNKYGPTFAFTVGGLIVDDGTGEVLGENGSPIPGLYAAGRTAVGLCSMGYMSGLAIADNVFSGRRAARHASRDANRRRQNERPAVSRRAS
jgi:3-oxo-5alpha-steroid 4-dehydrogenase